MRPEKPIIVKHIQDVLDGSGNFLLISYMGLSVKKQEELKSLLKEKNAFLQVHKNQLIKKAAHNKNYSDLADLELGGGTAIVFGEGEPSAWAKVIKTFAKANEAVSFKAAYFEGKVLDQKKAGLVAEMPSKDEARAMLLRTLLAGSAGGLATVIKNYTEKESN